MQTGIRIEQLKLSDKHQLLAFLREAYAENPRMSDERFWDWHFLENPYVAPDDLPVWLAWSGQRIAGQLAATPVRLQIGAERKPTMWILDLIVHDDFRRRGIAKQLVRKAEEFCAIGLGINTVEQHSTAVLESLGWLVPCKIPRYNKLLFAGNMLPEIARIAPLRRTLNLLSAPFRPRADQALFQAGGKLRMLDKFDAAFDELWNEASANWPCAVARESCLLDWQFVRQPGKKFDIIGYYTGDKLLGYAVVFVRKPNKSGQVAKASIADLCYHPDGAEETVDELLRAALDVAVTRGAGTLVTDVLDGLIERRLKRIGFRPVKNPLQFLVKSTGADEKLLQDARSWFLTRGDSDISIFEHPNL